LRRCRPATPKWLADLKARVRATQFRAVRAANAEVVELYWSIGQDIVERQERLGWGSKVIPQLAEDLRREFPDQTGWSSRNLQYMKAMAEAWADEPEFVPQVVAQMPWGHVRTLLDKLSDVEQRDWYARETVANGWSRAVLAFQIQSGLRERLGAAPSNFAATLPPPDSDLAQEMTKDPYVFQHAGLAHGMAERDLEQALIDRIQDTLLELGRGIELAHQKALHAGAASPAEEQPAD
jgi:predicted nuclease of restriction endonuclease-like (RecB) superfamily